MKEEKTNVLIIEDSKTQAMSLKHILEKNGYLVSVSENGKKALALIKKQKPHIIISDIVMPEMDGYELCDHIKKNKNLKDIPVILLTSLSDPRDITKGLESGADNFIIKPIKEESIISRIQYILINKKQREEGIAEMGMKIFFAGRRHFLTAERIQIIDLIISAYENAMQKNVALEQANEELRRARKNLKEQAQQMQRVTEGTINIIAKIVEMKDPYTAGHQYRVASLASAIARKMNLAKDIIDGISMAATVHDIGKVNIPNEILNKPGRLDENEFNMIKSHSEIGHTILKTIIEFPWPIADIVYQHHEKIDGSGYPLGLAGEKIKLEARILAVADVVEAMQSHRPYRPALGIDKALEEIWRNRGVLYDSKIVGVCKRLFINKAFSFG